MAGCVVAVNPDDEEGGSVAALPVVLDCEPGSAVTLAVPKSVLLDGAVFELVRWALDGAAQAAGGETVLVEVTGAHQAVAVYQPAPAP